MKFSLLNTSRLCFFSMGLLVCGCKDFLDIKPPKNQLVSETALKSDELANTVLTAIYSRMINAGNLSYRIPFYTGMYVDELKNNSTSSSIIPFYVNGLDANNTQVNLIWSTIYTYIYQSNSILEELSKNNIISEKVKIRLVGEARFIRAFWYFYLTEIFGDVPLITNTIYEKNAIAPNSSRESIYKQIVDDLKYAYGVLGENFVGADGLTVSVERVRASKWAACAMLARVSLYLEDFVSAESYASEIIAATATFKLDSNLNNVFLKNSSESIWQLQPVAGSINTPEGYNFILLTAPSSGEKSSSTISTALQNAFESGDKRKLSWIKSITVRGIVYNFPYKYKVASSSMITEYSSVLRLSEQYLIRAEARTHLGRREMAQSDLDVVRVRAGLVATTSTVDSIGLIRAIVKERQVELFAEWGHRWLDLKRLHLQDSVMSEVAPVKGAIWEPFKRRWPIPQTDRDRDPNLSQNPGYN